ncbi:putative ripening-related protein 1 [Triticum dicoccoides]|uniref:putative ripening-related protein 1 n=1 Tax=Triticum dicoccoides TaxID=85692 RepID=UPI00162C0B9B|nr:putative ripening-related protein 1 [Triticum dicoccoides]
MPPSNAHKKMTMSCLVVLALALAATVGAQECRRSGTLRPSEGHSCEDCCEAGKAYPTYRCSPPVVAGATRAIMTLNDFDEGGDGGDPSACDEVFHRNSERVVALSTGWYAGGSRCGDRIWIRANGRSVLAKVVDECDSLNGCDDEHAFQPPCRNNVVDASQAVWDALGITGEEVGEYGITWSDA